MAEVDQLIDAFCRTENDIMIGVHNLNCCVGL